MDDLDRMFRRLVQNVRDGYPAYLTRPFEISELYQNIIPYRHNRRELAIETNEDYELALMRLLAGERGFLQADETVQRAMEQELRSPNPNPSSFRAYAASLVSIVPDAVRRLEAPAAIAAPPASPSRAPRAPAAPPPPPAPPAPAARPSFAEGALANASPFAPDAPPAIAARPMAPTQAMRPQAPPPPPTAPQPPMPPTPQPRTSSAAAAPTTTAPAAHRAPPTIAGGGACRYCGGALPDGRRITYCPHCGQNLTIQHCPACGTELEVGWKFCVTCGRGVSASA